MDIEKANPEQLKAIIAEDLKNPVFLYMKGVPAQPRCGFSANVVKILQHIGVPFESRDVLASPALREAIKAYSDWPTLPQLYIAGEFVGGSDIITDLFKRGELQKMLAPMIDKPKTQNHNNS